MTGEPEVYVHGHHESVLRSHRWRTAENSAGYLLEVLEPTMTLLDVGCGPGTITADLAGRLPGGGVIGVDRVAGVLEAARATAEEAGVPTTAFAQGDVYSLPFAEEAFDVVHCHQVLQHLADPVGALAEMRRVCRAGGVVAAADADYGAMAWYPEVPELDRWKALYRKVARAAGGEPDGGRHLLAWAHRAGFSSVTPSAGVWCYATSPERSWWGGLWADRIVQSDFADQAIGRGLASPEDLEALAAGWRRWAAEEDGWFVVPHGQVLCRP